ncbi:single-stranded DNA-binding protein [Candidatus Aerophobetes bacterium]|uniref:Single-stranded DNA-binding protein n=1 Tax=Aerophobetes bacterium TaxID=2030807 RepID=A0A2A4YLP6_UNCAE|nr:MAG: single-stranded DNA-binding protein [Candidatus Aerophobetes bacterium]
MNHILIAGHLGADPEVRFTSSGQKVTALRVACNNRRSGKEETIWWKVTIWGEQFDKIIPYFKKGSPIMVAGDLSKPEIFTDREGNPQISLNITASNLMFSPFGKSDQKQNDNQQAQGGTQTQQANPFGDAPKQAPQQNSPFAESASFQPTNSMTGQGGASAFNDDEIPF